MSGSTSRKQPGDHTMAIDYIALSEKYRPDTITTLLIGEAPPPSGKRYFYLPQKMSDTRPIKTDTSLPATIFYHYFQRRPTTEDEYKFLLLQLQQAGIFLIDICDEPIKVRGCEQGVQRISEEVGNLRRKMSARGICVADHNIVFLLARKNYLKHIRREFPDSQYIPWIDFRMNPKPISQRHLLD